jgi:hypothetical protein
MDHQVYPAGVKSKTHEPKNQISPSRTFFFFFFFFGYKKKKTST